MQKKAKIEITSKILITLYKGHLPVAWGHLDPGGGKTWLGVSTADGYTKKGYGTLVVKTLCKYADNAGWDLWLTCSDDLVLWYKKYGFILISRDKVNYMQRKTS